MSPTHRLAAALVASLGLVFASFASPAMASGLDALVRAPAPAPRDLAGMARIRGAIDRTLAAPPSSPQARVDAARDGARLLLALHQIRLGGADGRFTVWTPPGGSATGTAATRRSGPTSGGSPRTRGVWRGSPV